MTTSRYSLEDGRWIELGEMTGRQFLLMRRLIAHRTDVTDADIEALMDALDAAAVGSSEDDPLSLSQSDLITLAFRWYTGVADDAVPPMTGTD